MNQEKIDDTHQINYLTTEMKAMYHQSSLKLGISDSRSIVLYCIYDAGGECLLSDVYKKSGITKQTINSAIRALEADDILYLEQYMGRFKKIILTEKGKDYTNQTVARLFEAELRTFDTWTREEINTYIRLMKKHADCFRQQIEKL